MEKYSILLVDDHQIVLDGLRSVLKNSPFSVISEASNGQEAFEWLSNATTKPDLVLTDISMPLLSGIELCVLIKEKYPAIKVLVLSMYDSSPMIREALSAEADGFVLKNIGREGLLTALSKIAVGGSYYSKEIVPILKAQQENKSKKEDLNVNLTKREIEILSLILKEYTSERIAEELEISKKTVDNHRANILVKTGYSTTIGLIKFALKIGLIGEEG